MTRSIAVVEDGGGSRDVGGIGVFFCVPRNRLIRLNLAR